MTDIITIKTSENKDQKNKKSYKSGSAVTFYEFFNFLLFKVECPFPSLIFIISVYACDWRRMLKKVSAQQVVSCLFIKYPLTPLNSRSIQLSKLDWLTYFSTNELAVKVQDSCKIRNLIQ